MGGFKDLTGQKFGRLTVVEKDVKRNGRWCWICECKCGNIVSIVGGDLTRKDKGIKSCGCLLKENGKNLKKFNIYNLNGEYSIGYTNNDEPFYFDLEDYDKIKNYCWSKDDNDYIIARDINNEKNVLMHRLVTNCPDDMEVDHIFHNRNDNRKEFLRIVTRSQNQMNVDLRSNNTSGVKGVSWHSRDEKWQAQIGINNKKIHLGMFDDFNEAVEVRTQAELEYFGEYNYKGKIN